MDKNLSRLCEVCGEERIVFLKKHYLGVHYVEQCKCGTRLCDDPHEINWPSYSLKDQSKVK